MTDPAPSNHAPTLAPLTLINDNPYQPRLTYDAERIAAIAASIAEHGLLQVPIARRVGDRYELAFGHSRLRAYQHLAKARPGEGWRAMPLIVRNLDDETMALHAWTENKDRADLTAYEEARAIERYTQVFGWSQKTVGEKLQLDRSTVSNKLRILKLPPAALELLARGVLSERQAQALVPLSELPEAVWGDYRKVSPQLVYLAGMWRHDLAEFLDGAAQASADEVRKAVKEVIEKTTIDLAKEPWAKEPWSLPEQRCTACADCALRLSGNRCPDRPCATLKRLAWQKRQAEAAAASAGLPPVAIAGGWSSYDDLGGVSLDGPQGLKAEALRRACGNLGVAMKTPGQHVYFTKSVKGFEGCGIVCAHGEGKKCACKAALLRNQDTKKAEAATKKAEKKLARVRYKEPAEQALAAQLAQAPLGVLRLLAGQLLGHSKREQLGTEPGQAALSQMLAGQLVHEAIKWPYEHNFDTAEKVREAAEKLLTTAQIPFPWAEAAPVAPFVGAALDKTPPAPDHSAQIAKAREHLSSARELATVAMADHFLLEAGLIVNRLPAGPDQAALIAEVAQAKADVLAARAQQQEEEAAGAAITAGRLAAADDALTIPWLRADRGVRAHLPQSDTGEPLSWAGVEQWLDELDQRITAGETGPAIEQGLELLSDQIDAYTDDESVETAAWEAASSRLDDLVGALASRDVRAA